MLLWVLLWVPGRSGVESYSWSSTGKLAVANSSFLIARGGWAGLGWVGPGRRLSVYCMGMKLARSDFWCGIYREPLFLIYLN